MKKSTFVFSSDDNYIIPTYVAIHSLINKLRHENQCEVYVLAPGNLSDSSKNIINSIQNEFNNLMIHFLNLGDSFNSLKLVLTHTTIATMYRLMLPSLLPDCDRCIYLDGDIIVKGDMSELFNCDMEGYYVGGVRDIDAEQYTSKFNYDCERPHADDYINAGLLLMNLKMMRDDNIEQQFMKLADKHLLFADQDIINIVCHGKIKLLELKYNTLIKYRFVNYKQKKYSNFITDKFSVQQIWDAYEHPVMIHYAQPMKPWQCLYVYKANEWYRYVKKEIPSKIYLEYVRPYIKKNSTMTKEKRNLFIHWLFYKSGILRILLNIRHRL